MYLQLVGVNYSTFGSTSEYIFTDLYLIQPPIGASHLPVNPNKIVICGDSSGGGLALALLQVIRDACLPLPAGGVLVSPWCDLTHSFHSIITNTDTVRTELCQSHPFPDWRLGRPPGHRFVVAQAQHTLAASLRGLHLAHSYPSTHLRQRSDSGS